VSPRDGRLHAFRQDLADERLAGEVEAERFVAGRAATVAVPVADLRREPRPDAGLSTQLLLGDPVRVYEEREGWAWLQSERDGYVGYAGAGALGPVPTSLPSHIVRVPRTFVYPGPDLKSPPLATLSLGARLRVSDRAETRGTAYAILAGGGAVVAGHVAGLGDPPVQDYVAVAESLLGTPYLWGGASAFGLDCSGLVQLAMHMAGRPVPRDSDMQAAAIGAALDPAGGLQRGDLVFWKGHVAMLTDPETILHASGHTMQVSREAFAEAKQRIAYLYGVPTGFRRP